MACPSASAAVNSPSKWRVSNGASPGDQFQRDRIKPNKRFSTASILAGAAMPSAAEVRADMGESAPRALPFAGRYFTSTPSRDYFKLGAAFFWANNGAEGDTSSAAIVQTKSEPSPAPQDPREQAMEFLLSSYQGEQKVLTEKPADLEKIQMMSESLKTGGRFIC